MPRFEPNPTRRPAIISGASSGIGAATAFALAEIGHPVALGARRLDECQNLADKINSAGGEAFAHYLDVTQAGSIDEFVTKAEDALGPTEPDHAAVLTTPRRRAWRQWHDRCAWSWRAPESEPRSSAPDRPRRRWE